MRSADLGFRVALVPARWVPMFVRNFIVWTQAQRDGKFGWYSRLDVALRWLGQRTTWSPSAHPVHARVEELLKPLARVEEHERERRAVEKELAKLTSFWVLATLFTLLFIGDLFGSIQLFKSLGFDGFRRLLMAFALSAVLFALPLLAVRFYTKKTKAWFYIITAVLLLVIAAIGTLQLNETSAQSDAVGLQDVAAGALLSLAVIGPALLAKFVLTALLPVWQLRNERALLLREIGAVNREQRMAQAYVRDFHLYAEWYASHAAQIASVYRRAFARKYLAVHNDPQTLRQMLDEDSLHDLDEAPAPPKGTTPEIPPAKRQASRQAKSRRAPRPKAVEGGKAENPYQRLQ